MYLSDWAAIVQCSGTIQLTHTILRSIINDPRGEFSVSFRWGLRQAEPDSTIRFWFELNISRNFRLNNFFFFSFWRTFAIKLLRFAQNQCFWSFVDFPSLTQNRIFKKNSLEIIFSKNFNLAIYCTKWFTRFIFVVVVDGIFVSKELL